MYDKKLFCSNCNKDISILHIKCVECENLEFCFQCFSAGVELHNHLKTHKYLIADNGTFSLFDSNWSAEEEHLLIDSVEQFGLGNWDEVAANIPDKSASEVEEHYKVVYVEGQLGKLTLPPSITNKITDHTPPVHESVCAVTQPRTEVNKQQQQEIAFMPNRDDYEFEFDNNAESVISSLFMSPDDGDLDRSLKLAKVAMYHMRLMERQRRKSVIREYRLVDRYFRKDKSTFQSKYEKEIRLKLRCCSQFMKTEQFEKLLKDLLKERKLKRKIARLKNYRKNGITRFSDCTSFDAGQYQRDKKLNSNNKLTTGNTAEKPARSELDRRLVGLKSQPAYYLLGSGEKHLCLNMNMDPASYLTAKMLVVKDSLLKQHSSQNKTRYSASIEKSHRRRILNFLKENSWLPS